MSQPKLPEPVKLFAGFLYRQPELRQQVWKAMTARLGPLDLLTTAAPFTYTRYYEKEMGSGIYRQFASFLNLVAPDELPDIKRFTNELEQGFAEEGRRRVNIDPGILSEERLVLATGKNYTHRVYLRDGIYADLTLVYQDGGYQDLDWTYPDYREPELKHLLKAVRAKLIFQKCGRLPRKPTILKA